MRYLIALILVLATFDLKSQNDTCTGQFDAQSKKHGLWICRSGNRVVKKVYYRHGELKSYILYNEKGEIIETRNKRGKVKKYTPCGC